MSASATPQPAQRLSPLRAEHLALGGGGLQLFTCLVALAITLYVGSLALEVLLVQAAVAAGVWLASWFHLRLRREQAEEEFERREAERRRASLGLESLFEAGEQGPAARNLRHMDAYIAPAISLLVAVGLLLPVVYAAMVGAGTSGLHRQLQVANPMAVFFACMFPAFFCFLLGMYAAGLSREPGADLLRAGAGNMIATAICMAATGLALALSQYEWLASWPDRVVAMLVSAWMVLQALEILVNLVLDIYRPRLAGVQARPGYDSRVSGLLAEPQGIFRTFAHTLDYQFGFKVSETWFFKFLEKALAPLLLIQLVALYLLTCLVVVEPGQAAIVERWGAPRGVARLPSRDADWDRLAPPLGPGLHLKWPWPIETVRICDRRRVRAIYLGFNAADEAEARAKADKLAGSVVTWDTEHVKDEIHYLMPLPGGMSQSAADKGRRRGTGAGTVPAEAPDALMLSGEFVIRYCVGGDATRPGDLYRFVYGFRRPGRVLRAVCEREVAAMLAGADFWDVFSRKPLELRKNLLARLRSSIGECRLGVRVLSLTVHNLHPPAGEVGKAFMQVLASRQEREAEIYAGEAEAIRIEHAIPSEVNHIVTTAESYRTRRELVAAAEADRFRNRLLAWRLAPAAYLARVRMRVLEEALTPIAKTVLPRSVVSVIDNSKVLTPDMVEMQKGVVKAGENP